MKTELRKSTDPAFDADTLIVTLPNSSALRVYAYEGHDGVPVIQIDQDGSLDRMRVNLNDGPIWDGNPDTDDLPGEHMHTGVLLSRDQIEAWARSSITDDELTELRDCIPESSIPDAINVIVNEAIR